MRTRTVRLAHGLWDGDACHRQVLLQEPGWDDVAELGRAEGLPAAEWTRRVLAACLRPVAGRSAAQAASDLTVGDQAAALLALHGLLAPGPGGLRALAACASCGEALEVEAPASLAAEAAGQADPDLRPAGASPAGPAAWHETTVGGVAVRFRLPTGADLEAVAGLGELAPQELASRLLAAQPGGAVRPAEAEARIAAAVAELDPLAEVRLQAACPACGAAVEALLDPAAQVQADLRSLAERQEWEVHRLASRYGWTERDVLQVPPERRRRYLALLAAEGR